MSGIHAIVLAAGFSRRMGTDKLSQDLCGKTVLQRCIDQIIESGVERVYVVIREREQTAALVKNARLRFVVNEEAESGMASSIKVAIMRMEGNPAGILIVNGDMPFFGADNYADLIRIWKQTDNGIASAYYMGEIRNPVIFARRFLPDLLTIEGDRGAKKIAQRNLSYLKFMEILDPVLLTDIDTPEDLEYARSMCNRFQ